MKAFELFEKKFLFSTTRVVFLVMAALCALGLIMVTVKFASSYTESKPNTTVSADSVFSKIAADGKKDGRQNGAPQQDGGYANQIESDLNIPQPMKDVFTGRNKEVLDGWLGSLDKKDRQNFIDEMYTVFQAATEKEKANAEKGGETLRAAINTFKEMKVQKIKDRDLQKLKFDSSLTIYAGALAALIALLALLSLVLVLLAIERNTRPAMPLNIDMKRF